MSGENTVVEGATERAQLYLRSGRVKASLLLIDRSLTPDEKRWILEQRVADLSAELRASEENMTSDRPGVAGENLRDAQRALLALDASRQAATAR